MKLLTLLTIIIPNCFFGQINWTIYNVSNSPLPYNQVNDIALDINNNLIIGTEYGLATLNNYEDWNIYLDEGENLGLISNIVKSIEINLNNDIWACGPDGVSIIHANDNWSYLNTSNSDLPSNFVRSILFEDDAKTWIGSTGGLVLIENNIWNIYDFGAIAGIFSNNITKIIKHPSNENVFIGTLNGGLVNYNSDFTFFNNTNSELLDNTIVDLIFDTNENLIMTTPFGGLGVLSSTNSWIWFNSETNPSLPFFINSLGDISIDNNNNLWIVTIEDGLIKYSNNNWTFYNTENSNIPDDNINCITYDNINNCMWIGTETEGLVLMDLENINISETSNNPILKIQNPHYNTSLIIESKKQTSISIFNYNGSLIKTVKLEKGLNSIYMNECNSGIYFIYTPELNNHLYQIMKI